MKSFPQIKLVKLYYCLACCLFFFLNVSFFFLNLTPKPRCSTHVASVWGRIQDKKHVGSANQVPPSKICMRKSG